MKSFVEQVAVLAVVVAAALFSRVAFAESADYGHSPLQHDAAAFQQALEQANSEAPTRMSPDEMQDLLRIRQLISSPSPEQFVPPTLDPSEPSGSAPPTYRAATATGAPQPPQPQLFSPPRPEGGPHTREHRCIASLRGTATQLDNAANQLEQCELYDQADMLRETAQRLRIDARRLAGHGHEADQDHPLPFGFTDPPAPHFDHPWSQPQGGDSLDPGPGPGGQPAVPELRAQPLEQLSDGSQPPSAGQNNDPPAASSDPPRGDGEPTGDRIR